jgi:hypothetical protein
MGVECQSGILPNMQSIADNRSEFIVIAAGAVWFELWQPVSTVSVIAVIGLLVGGWPILKQAFENLLARRMTMELSMTIAIVAAAVIGEFFTALLITLFVLVAEVLEGMTVSHGRHAIHDLVHFPFLPQTVCVRRPGRARRPQGLRRRGLTLSVFSLDCRDKGFQLSCMPVDASRLRPRSMRSSLTGEASRADE